MYYKAAVFFFKIYYALFFRLRVHGLENVPKDGACILCANHISNYDVITLVLSLGRLPTYLAKKELFGNKLIAHVLLKLKAIPIDRSKADMTAYRAVMDTLKQGGMIGIFAHGTRIKDADAAAVKSGVAMFAVKSQSPVVPCAIVTDYKFFRKIDVIFGTPVDFAEYKDKRTNSDELSEIAQGLMRQVDGLMSEFKDNATGGRINV